MTFLEQILHSTEAAVKRRQEARPLRVIQQSLVSRADDRAFRHALEGDRMSVIAEFKRTWPSMERPPSNADLKEVLAAYARGEASAVSILTEESFFNGQLADLRRAREVCSLPILRKDFIIDEYQVYEAAEAGADAILLIVAVAVLRRVEKSFERLYQLARSLGLDVLVEVREERELEIALEMEADLIGINNRDLDKPHDVAFATTRDLLPRLLPEADVLVVSESGLRTARDLEELAELGVGAALIGTALMMSPNREATCRELTHVAPYVDYARPQMGV